LSWSKLQARAILAVGLSDDTRFQGRGAEKSSLFLSLERGMVESGEI
jgi:hypothetical protein